MDTLFTKIVNGEIPSYKVAENENFYAFLDINPLAIGHTLVIPKRNTDYIFDIEDEEYCGLFLFAKKVAAEVEVVEARNKQVEAEIELAGARSRLERMGFSKKEIESGARIGSKRVIFAALKACDDCVPARVREVDVEASVCCVIRVERHAEQPPLAATGAQDSR